MKRVAWVTDIHLNFLEPDERCTFLQRLARERVNALLVSGDIGEADSVGRHLTEMETALQIPILFVLGNHDFYKGSIREVREQVNHRAEQSGRLVYLSVAGVIELTPETCVIGHDGWADARLGGYERSDVLLNDYLLIEELADLDRNGLRQRLEALGDEAAEHLRSTLCSAVERYRRVLLVTHVPPFREACWYNGRISDDNWLPHFSCRAAGDAIRGVMRDHPECQTTVLCGHTHGSGQARILDNLEVITGGARYGHPDVQLILEL